MSTHSVPPVIPAFDWMERNERGVEFTGEEGQSWRVCLGFDDHFQRRYVYGDTLAAAHAAEVAALRALLAEAASELDLAAMSARVESKRAPRFALAARIRAALATDGAR